MLLSLCCRVRPHNSTMDSTYSMEAAPDGAGLTSLDVLLFLDVPVNSTEEQCFSARSRSTVLEGLPFGGVPTVLAINFILWLVSGTGGAISMGSAAPTGTDSHTQVQPVQW